MHIPPPPPPTHTRTYSTFMVPAPHTPAPRHWHTYSAPTAPPPPPCHPHAYSASSAQWPPLRQRPGVRNKTFTLLVPATGGAYCQWVRVGPLSLCPLAPLPRRRRPQEGGRRRRCVICFSSLKCPAAPHRRLVAPAAPRGTTSSPGPATTPPPPLPEYLANAPETDDHLQQELKKVTDGFFANLQSNQKREPAVPATKLFDLEKALEGIDLDSILADAESGKRVDCVRRVWVVWAVVQSPPPPPDTACPQYGGRVHRISVGPTLLRVSVCRHGPRRSVCVHFRCLGSAVTGLRVLPPSTSARVNSRAGAPVKWASRGGGPGFEEGCRACAAEFVMPLQCTPRGRWPLCGPGLR